MNNPRYIRKTSHRTRHAHNTTQGRTPARMSRLFVANICVHTKPNTTGCCYSHSHQPKRAPHQTPKIESSRTRALRSCRFHHHHRTGALGVLELRITQRTYKHKHRHTKTLYVHTLFRTVQRAPHTRWRSITQRANNNRTAQRSQHGGSKAKKRRTHKPSHTIAGIQYMYINMHIYHHIYLVTHAPRVHYILTTTRRATHRTPHAARTQRNITRARAFRFAAQRAKRHIRAARIHAWLSINLQ